MKKRKEKKKLPLSPAPEITTVNIFMHFFQNENFFQIKSKWILASF